MFIDKAHIYVSGGRGGSGSNSFRREKHVPFGGPDGGNGGKGGDVFLVADQHLTTLLDLTYKPHYRAKDGQPGSGCNCYGRCAEDLIMKVPCGTIVRRRGESDIVADLKEDGQRFLAAAGGRGGRGNSSFKTSRNTAPRMYEKGEPGVDIEFDLELKLIADVGLVGFPNAGKSTLLSSISAARPKIADYPFTTLSPNLGVSQYAGKSFVVADIPGLIEGAHTGKGLGDEFLRHIERTRILVHIVDLFGFDEHTAYQNYKTINKELERYSKKLASKKMIVVANKSDLTDSAKKLAELKRHLKGKKIYEISAATGKGIDVLMGAIIKELAKPVTEEPVEEPVRRYVYEPDFVVTIAEDGAFAVTGKKIEKLAEMSDFNEDESLRRFQNILKKMGVEKAMKEKGAEVGDLVRIGTLEFEYQK